MHSYADEIIRLCDELHRSLIITTLGSEQSLNQALHIAQTSKRKKLLQYFLYESHGYPDDLKDKEILGWSSRYHPQTDKYIMTPLLEIEGQVPSLRNKLDYASRNIKLGSALANLSISVRDGIEAQILRSEAIIRAFRRNAHALASQVRLEMRFSNQSDAIFSSYQRSVDPLISQQSGEALSKLPAVFERLGAGDIEAISHALTSCRRIIESFASSVCPPQDDPVDYGDEKLSITADKPLNRLRFAVHNATESKKRRDRLNKNIAELWGRVSAGVHSDVSADEARSLVLNTYLFLGEIVEMRAAHAKINGKQ